MEQLEQLRNELELLMKARSENRNEEYRKSTISKLYNELNSQVINTIESLNREVKK